MRSLRIINIHSEVYNILIFQVNNPKEAVIELEQELGMDLLHYMEGTVAVPEKLQLDMKKLKSYLNWALKLHDKGTLYMWVKL